MTNSDDAKIGAMYIARSEGKIIQFRDAVNKWHDLGSHGALELSNRIKPQTVEEATIEWMKTPMVKHDTSLAEKLILAAEFGAKWQKEQTND